MTTALFINGVYEDTLSPIYEVQAKDPDEPHFLQPYSDKKIKLLADEQPTPQSPITLYMSLTDSLDKVSYRARIVGWRDKHDIGEAELETLNKRIKQLWPKEEAIYRKGNGDKECVNLISIVRLEKIDNPFPVSYLIKVSDKLPLAETRTQSGGWSPVEEMPRWPLTSVLEDVDEDLARRVRLSSESTSSERQARLAIATGKPEAIQVTSIAFRRNADVIAEVLSRANGLCAQCGSAAPFLRASDGKPYLEVHHKKPLSQGGDDTVENATALCPNCHRQNHFGKVASCASNK